MAEFHQLGGPDEENAEIKRLNAEVEANPDSIEGWEKLIRACESLEGGLSRNSSAESLATLRDAYDRFLLKFPLLFGYWKKYADLEFNISGPESAEMVYERGCASISHSVDLWTEYCSFKMETTHVPNLVRELFERGAACIGIDYLAHPFWDKYIEYEERQDAQDKIFAIYLRLIHIPSHQIARYYDKLRAMSTTRPLQEMTTADRLASLRTEVEMEAASRGEEKSESELEDLVRGKIEGAYYEIFTKNSAETTRRFPYEAEIKRPYFHVDQLDNVQLANWRKYLDFEEQEGSYARICFLYERCLMSCALYEEFWFRYARWMSAQPGKTEEVRHIYLRAATLYVPISRPGIRLQYAYLEESAGRVDVARDIHNAILAKLPGCTEVIISLAHLERRQGNVEAAIAVYKEQIDSPEVDIWTKAVLVTEWAYLMWRAQGSVDEARAVFQKNVQWYSGSREFWQKWIQLELEQPTNDQLEAQQSERLKDIFTKLGGESSMSAASKKELCAPYLAYLQQRGGKGAMEQFLLIDRDMFGPASVSFFSTGKSGTKENGVAVTEMDEATRQKAEAIHYGFYQLHTDPNPAAQGFASFH